MENPIKMDDLGVPLFLETPIYIIWIPNGRSHWILNREDKECQEQMEFLMTSMDF